MTRERKLKEILSFFEFKIFLYVRKIRVERHPPPLVQSDDRNDFQFEFEVRKAVFSMPGLNRERTATTIKSEPCLLQPVSPSPIHPPFCLSPFLSSSLFIQMQDLPRRTLAGTSSQTRSSRFRYVRCGAVFTAHQFPFRVINLFSFRSCEHVSCVRSCARTRSYS